MRTFWASVPEADKLLPNDVVLRFPNAEETEAFDPQQAEYAFSALPNLGPGGPTSEQDEADLEERDPNEEVTDPDGPTLAGDMALMAYVPGSDELYTYKDGRWLLWNY